MSIYTGSSGSIWLQFKHRQLYATLQWHDNGRHAKYLGRVPVTPTPLLDLVLELSSTDKLNVEHLIRLRDTDKDIGRVIRKVAAS